MSQRLRRGDIVLIQFPFTDLSGTKRRPAAILAEYPRTYMGCGWGNGATTRIARTVGAWPCARPRPDR